MLLEDLANWSDFYAFVGGAAATLLGLLFVAVSLRLDIFRNAQVADVRDFAWLTLISFLAALIITGLALMPHQAPMLLAIPLLMLGVAGLVSIVWVVREWLRLNRSQSQFAPGLIPRQWQSWLYIGLDGAAFVVMPVVAVLFWRGNSVALPLMAGIDGLLLIMGTISAWIMLSNAGAASSPATADTT